MTNENRSEDPIDVLVKCSLQDLNALDYICDSDTDENDEHFKSNNEDEESHVTFDPDDLREWLEDDGESSNQIELTGNDFDPMKVMSSSKLIKETNGNLENETALTSKAIKHQHPFKSKLIESLKKLESSMHRTEMSRRQILRHKNQTRALMSGTKFHKRKSSIVKSTQTRKRLSDFAPQLTHNNYRKRSSLAYELEDSRKRLNSLLLLSRKQNPNALTA